MSSDTPHEFDPSPAEALAAVYVADVADGVEADPDAYATQLDDDASRAEFLALVRGDEQVASLLPVQVRPGVTLSGRYRVVREIGAGGMGKVFEGRDEQLQRRVALKVLAVFGDGAFDSEQMFRREAVLLAQLSHPNIVAIHEVARDGDVNYIVMDLVEGTPLDTVIEAAHEQLGGQPPRSAEDLARALGWDGSEPLETEAGGGWFDAVAHVALELTRTLEAAHGQGLVHRDIKPQNVILRDDATPVVLDFGLAGATETSDGGAVTQGLFGSVAYLAPEQAITGRVGADPRTDVYQLGAVFYELLTLQRAYPGTGMTDMLKRITIGRFETPRSHDKGIPFELEAICLKAMELNPRDRYQSVAELREDLERYVTGSALPVAARKGRWGTAWRSVRYTVRRRRTSVLVAAAALVAVVTSWAAGLGDTVVNEGERVQFFRVTGESSGAGAGAATGELAEAGAPVWSTDDDGTLFVQTRGRMVYAMDGMDDPARPGDLLGAELSVDQPTHVYALSVWGQKDPPDYVAPMLIRVKPVEGAEPVELATVGDWGLRTSAGDVQLACTEVSPYDASTPYEGLWLFTADDELPIIEDWFDAMSRMPNGVATLDQARKALEQVKKPVVTRGTQVHADDERLSLLGERVTVADLIDLDSDWPHDAPRFHRVFFAVDP